MQTQTLILNSERNVTLTACLQAVGGSFSNIPRRPAIVILPGGGYQYCSDREADPVAFAYLKAGFQTFILRYSVGKDAVWPNPLEDYEQAMELIRANADRWNVWPDKIAVIGFSAGGHLAAAAATMSRNRPNAAILGYAVADEDVKGCNPTAPGAVAAVDENTCPCFLFATRNDAIVPVENTVNFMQALVRAGVTFESHIYSHGPHGFSTGDSSVQKSGEPISPRVPNWVDDSIGWLRDVLGDFGEGAMTPPQCARRVNGDCEPFLSAGCTVGCLLKNEEARKLLPELVQREKEMGGDAALLHKMTLQGLYSFLKVPETVIEALDARLQEIPNI